MRWMYVPKHGSTGKYRTAGPLPEYVNIATARLQTMMSVEDIVAQDFRDMIECVQHEETLKDRAAIKKEKQTKK